MNLQRHDVFVRRDSWEELKTLTPARIALGRAGVSVPVHHTLAFRMAHAVARDAVYSSLDFPTLQQELESIHGQVHMLNTRAFHRQEYLLRPDLGRRLSEQSTELVTSLDVPQHDLAIILADGLSARAINRHAVPLLRGLLPLLIGEKTTVAPVTIVEHGRVAVGDEIGQLMNVNVSLVLIGERPGLTAPESLGAYLTFGPRIGNTDEGRNCVSNIHENGMSYRMAAETLSFLVRESLRLKLSGVQLKVSANLPDRG